jgi:hypothetical protein
LLCGVFEGEELFVSPNISVWFYPQLQGTRASPRVLLHIEGDGPDEPSVFQETGLSL